MQSGLFQRFESAFAWGWGVRRFICQLPLRRRLMLHLALCRRCHFKSQSLQLIVVRLHRRPHRCQFRRLDFRNDFRHRRLCALHVGDCRL